MTLYLVFLNSHDGSSGVSYYDPGSVVYLNTLNLALGTCSVIWTARHVPINVLLQVRMLVRPCSLANNYMGSGQVGIHGGPPAV